MVFGDPALMADPDAPGGRPGGPWWAYAAMWLIIGLVVAAIPGILLIGSMMPDRVPSPPLPGGTDAFDGTYSGIEMRLTEDRHLIRACSSGGPPRPLVISHGSARISLADSIGEGPVTVDGSAKMPVGGNLLTLQIDHKGIARGRFDTRYCSYDVVWRKE